MIIVKYQGGIGNQMFQYALALKLQSMGKEVKLDTSYFDQIPEGDTGRTKYLQLFRGMIPEATTEEIEDCTKRVQNKTILQRVVRKVGMHTNEDVLLMEEDHGFHPEIWKMKSGYLMGYWQSEAYFKDIANEVRQSFQFDQIFHEKTKNFPLDQILLPEIEVSNSVSVHVRAGDYLNNTNSPMFGNICTDDYYQNAMDRLQEKQRDLRVFLFTNDAEWTRKHISLASSSLCKVVDWHDEQTGYLDLYLMSKCRHHILANSSFSWWGAWLADQNRGQIYVPQKWINNEDCDYIYCPEWIKI